MLILLNERFPQTVSRLCLYHETPPDLKLKVPSFVTIDVDKLSPRFNVKFCVNSGEGPLYKTLKYNVLIVGACLVVLVFLIGAIVYQDKKRNELGTEVMYTK